MVSTDRIIEILNDIREDFEMQFSECEHVKDCETCKECYAYEAAQALGWAIKAVKSTKRLGDAVEAIKRG